MRVRVCPVDEEAQASIRPANANGRRAIMLGRAELWSEGTMHQKDRRWLKRADEKPRRQSEGVVGVEGGDCLKYMEEEGMASSGRAVG